MRTLEIRTSATLDVLHEALLVCFGWSGERLHEFMIRAAGYSSDWMVDALDTRDVKIASLDLRVGERFTWCYDFLAGWVIDLRVEAVAVVDGQDMATIECVRGKRAGPPEWVGGPGGSRRGRTVTAFSSSSSASKSSAPVSTRLANRSSPTAWRSGSWRWRVGQHGSGS